MQVSLNSLSARREKEISLLFLTESTHSLMLPHRFHELLIATVLSLHFSVSIFPIPFYFETTLFLSSFLKSTLPPWMAINISEIETNEIGSETIIKLLAFIFPPKTRHWWGRRIAICEQTRLQRRLMEKSDDAYYIRAGIPHSRCLPFIKYSFSAHLMNSGVCAHTCVCVCVWWGYYDDSERNPINSVIQEREWGLEQKTLSSTYIR